MKNKYYIFDQLYNDKIISIFTKKDLDFNTKTNSIDNIKNNYKEIEQDINYGFKRIIKPNQIHSSNVGIITESNINNTFENTDGLITNIRGIALVTSLADCQGIVIYDKNKKVIGNIHSGWKGTINKIIVNAINILINDFNSNVEDIQVFIYPSIHKCCFEVDEDVKDLFTNNFDDIDDCILKGNLVDGKQKYYIDTLLINKKELLKLGINENNIYISNECTKCNCNIYHSYRAEKEKSGRNIALVCLK